MRSFTVSIFLLLLLISSCSIQKQIARQADVVLLKDSSISTGHIGISIYESATGKYWYEYDATKYFTPASNTKLFTLYAGMKYLGDSLVGLRYQQFGSSLILYPAADPTFLHEDFPNQPVVKFIQNTKASYITLELNKKDLFKKYGAGWAWDDASEKDMVERSSFPFYGNTIKVTIDKDYAITTIPVFNSSPPAIAIPEKQFDFRGWPDIFRGEQSNFIFINKDKIKPGSYYIPFTNYSYSVPLSGIDGLIPYEDTIHKHIIIDANAVYNPDLHKIYDAVTPINIIHSQPADSLFKPMMHRSDNFFAEQTLLMVSNEHLGYMNDEAIIDTLLKSDLKDVPQKPKWVDGCGLSRYNLFTPQSFIYILNKMKNEFGLNRLKNILATGGEGTLSAYYKKDAGYIFAKTGTLSNICALSGFLYTQKGKLLIFSILANHYQGNATPVRKAVEKFLETIRNSY
jgi:D-alanyl-D-alanine carboxypeptidase/D-alanyl-D-alanine-endopeptidase (penicillin-binding protein 4)